MIKLDFVAKIIFTIFLFQKLVSAQDVCSLKINIHDQNSNPIPNATVHVKDLNDKIIKKLISLNSEKVVITLPLGEKFNLEILSSGFKPFNHQITLNESTKIIDVTLEIDAIKEEVNVGKEVIENSIENALNKTWTPEEIEALPFNPQDIETELKNKYGEDVIIRVNGFTGGQLPPKEQISSIKVIKSSFDSEFHALGKTIVDIRTKAGISDFFGVFAFNFNDAKLNARNAFAKFRLPEQNKLFFGYLSGPIIRKKASFDFLFLINNSFETKNIVAIVPNKEVNRRAKTSSETIISTIGVDFNLNQTHILNFNYSIGKTDSTNVGIGELKLAESGFSTKDKFHQVRMFESGLVNKKFVNEFKFEFINNSFNISPNDLSPSITVLGSFISGGAVVNNQLSLQKINLTDNIFFDKAKHFIKFGSDFHFERRKILSKDGTNGSFIFTSLSDFQNNKPSIFTQRQTESLNIINQAQIAFYIQDDIRLYRNLQIGLGLRYEVQNNLSDYDNFSPRLSLVYSPNKEGKIVFRSGLGLFYNWLESETLSNISGNTLKQSPELIVIRQNYNLPPSIKTLSSNLINPVIFVTQTGLNFRANKRLNLEVLYKFQKGNHLFRSRDINAPINGNRPNPLFGRISQLESSGVFLENSLDLVAEGSLMKGATFNIKYRLAKLMNNFDGIFDLPMDNYNLNNENGFSALDRRHKVIGNLNFLLFKKLQVTPIFQFYSPLPYTIITGKDENNDTVFNDRPESIKRNSERNGWLKQVDLRLSWRMTFKAENKSPSTDNSITNEEIIKSLKKSVGINIIIQNVLNSTNFQNYVGNQLSPFYKKATSSTTARRIQIGMNFIF
jgi:hypothetical protein